MEVLLLTTLFSIVFALLFLGLFVRDRQLRDFGGVDREALLPLDEVEDSRSSPSLQVTIEGGDSEASASRDDRGMTPPDTIS